MHPNGNNVVCSLRSATSTPRRVFLDVIRQRTHHYGLDKLNRTSSNWLSHGNRVGYLPSYWLRSLAVAARVTAAPQIDIPYSTLREWSPGGGLGIEVLLERDDLTEQDLVEFVKQISSGHDTVVAKIYSSKVAWEQEKDNNFGPEYKSDYLVYFVSKGGINEIRWMQEVGNFADKYGTKTPL